jgi:membrane protein implicated in regulation of membrane protease activity
MAGTGKRPPDGIIYGGFLALVVLLISLDIGDVGLIKGLKIELAGVLLVGTVIAVTWVIWHLRNRPATPTALELSRRFEAVHSERSRVRGLRGRPLRGDGTSSDSARRSG